MTPTELHFHFHFHLPPVSSGPVGGGSGKDAAAEAPGGQRHFEGQAAEEAAAADQAGNEPGSSAPPSATNSEAQPAGEIDPVPGEPSGDEPRTSAEPSSVDGGRAAPVSHAERPPQVSEPEPAPPTAGPAEAEEFPAPQVSSASTFPVCERCGASFRATRSTKRFCSEPCRLVAERERTRERERAKRAASAEARPAPAIDRVEREVVNRNATGSGGPATKTVALARVSCLEKPEPTPAPKPDPYRERAKRESVIELHHKGHDFETIAARVGLFVEDVRRIVLAEQRRARTDNAGVVVTAELMGDPAPGRSALDQRRSS